MNSSMIGKIEKAHRYAAEPERIEFRNLDATFRGSHDDYEVKLTNGQWECSCHTFSSHVVGTCSHVMAMQHILSSMLREHDRYGEVEPIAATG